MQVHVSNLQWDYVGFTELEHVVETGEQGRSRIFGRGSTTLSEAADSVIKLRLGPEA